MSDRQSFFSHLNRFFDNVFVITLRRATDRHAHIEKELAGLEYELFFGHDKQGFSITNLQQQNIYNEVLAKKHHRYGKPMPAGAIGCAWSHAEVYKAMIEKGYKKVLILEDDVVIDIAQIGLWPSIENTLPASWELLYLGFAEKENAPPLAPLKKAVYHLQRLFGQMAYSHKSISNLYPKKISAHLYKAGYHDCTHAYGVTQSAAQKLLALQTPISFVADNLLAHAATNEIIEAYLIQPKLINQQYQLGTTSVSYLHN